MATPTRTHTSRTAARRAPAPIRRTPRWLWPAAAALVVLLAVVAIVATRDDGSAPVASGLAQTRPVTVSGTPLPTLVSPDADTAVGQLAPELRGATFDGSSVNVTHDGRPKVLIFAAHWCPHCQREIPLIARHLAAQPLPSGVDLVVVSTSASEERPNWPPSAWLRDEGWSTPVLADDAMGSAATAYGLPGFPYFVAIDAGGKVVSRTSGEIPMVDFDGLISHAMGTAG